MLLPFDQVSSTWLSERLQTAATVYAYGISPRKCIGIFYPNRRFRSVPLYVSHRVREATIENLLWVKNQVTAADRRPWCLEFYWLFFLRITRSFAWTLSQYLHSLRKMIRFSEYVNKRKEHEPGCWMQSNWHQRHSVEIGFRLQPKKSKEENGIPADKSRPKFRFSTVAPLLCYHHYRRLQLPATCSLYACLEDRIRSFHNGTQTGGKASNHKTSNVAY